MKLTNTQRVEVATIVGEIVRANVSNSNAPQAGQGVGQNYKEIYKAVVEAIETS